MSSRARKVANLKREATGALKDVKDEVKTRPAQISTAISDAALALASFGCAYMSTQSFIGYFGFLIIGLAAFVGVFKFSGLHQLDLFHKLASMAATTVGVPLMGIAFVHPENNLVALKVSIYLTLTFSLAAALFYYIKFNAWQTLAPLIGIVSAIYGSASTSQYLGVVGAVLYVVSGLAIGTEGKIGSFKRVDLFHYGLTASNLILAFALRNISTHN